MDNASGAPAVIAQYSSLLAGRATVVPLGNAGGLSGSVLWQVRAADGSVYCLRQWPVEHPTAERLLFIHSVLRHVAGRLPVVAQPLVTDRGVTFVRQEGHYWELTRWLPGEPDADMPARESRARAAMAMLAQFHAIAAEFQSTVGPAPAIDDRVRLINAARQGGLAAIEHAMAMPVDEEIDCRCRKLLPLVKFVLGREGLVEDELDKHAEIKTEIHIQPRKEVALRGDQGRHARARQNTSGMRDGRMTASSQ